VVHDRTPGSTEGAGANLLGKTREQALPEGNSKYEKAAKASGSAAVNMLGFDNSRRKLAKRLGVDPYTTNRVLDEKLDEVTWSIFAGDFGIDVATSLIPGSIVVSTSSLETNWVWDTPPGDLRVKIEEVLLRLNISQGDVDRLLRHRSYPLSYQAALTFALEALGEVQGHEQIMSMALSVKSIDQARFVVNSLRMLKQYHETMQPIEVLHVQGTIFASNDKDRLIIAAPVDYLSWIDVVDKFSGNSKLSGKKPELYIAGAASELVNEQLTLRGWTIHQNSELFTTMGDGEQK